MNADRLLELYDRIADAPDAIARLRRFVLDLAVRGKLVEQDPADEPASELLERIAAEKARLVKAKEIRKPKALPHNDPELWPFEIPNAWTWTRIDELSPRSLTDGDWIETKDQSEDGGVRLIQLADVGVGAFLDKSARFITAETEVRLNCTRLAVGDVLIARLPNPIGRACIFPEIGQPAITAVDVAILRPDGNVAADFIVHAMNAPPTRDQIEAYGKGATRFRVSTGHLKTVLVPLPPLAEQRRIVAKVDELMALLDRLEAARSTREATRDRLTAASLTRLTAPDTDTEAFPNHALFALDALPALTARPNQIKQLRQTILNLAVRGKLVEQDPADEPASELLKRIAAEKDRLYKAKETRKPKAVPPLEDEELPFPLPFGWAWTQIAELGVISPRNVAPDDYEASFVPMPLIAAEYGVPNEHEPRPWGAIKKGYTHFSVGDVGLAKITPCFENGKSTVFRNLTGGLGAGTTELHVVRPLFVDAYYIVLFLKCPYFIETGIPKMTGTAGQKRVPTEYFTSSPFPLPPLAEQNRIVAKVDELMALLDRLEAALVNADTTRQRLLEALLHEALKPGEDQEAA